MYLWKLHKTGGGLFARPLFLSLFDTQGVTKAVGRRDFGQELSP